MISKKVGISPKNDNYARLAEYIADAGHKGEKSLMHWCAGCLGDDDYHDGIAEAVDVQAMNTRQRSLGEKAALIEAHTGQQSFESYAKAHRDNILCVLATATDWQTLHEGLAVYGMEIKPHGSGLVVADRHNQRHTVKASAVDRGLSLKKFAEKIGPYLPARGLEKVTEQSRYQHTPLHRTPERGALYAEYQQGIEKRKTGLATVKEQEDEVLAAIREKWSAKRRESFQGFLHGKGGTCQGSESSGRVCAAFLHSGFAQGKHQTDSFPRLLFKFHRTQIWVSMLFHLQTPKRLEQPHMAHSPK